MIKTPFQKMLSALMLFYLSLFCFFLPYFVDIYFLSPIFSALGMFFLILSALTLFYNKLSKKIDAISNQIPNMNIVGIERIIPANFDTYSFLEKLIAKSNNVKIAINIQRLTDKLCYFLTSLLENQMISFQIIILGQSDDPKKQYFVKDLCKRQKAHITIKTLKNPQIDNLMIFDDQSCIMNYNNYDNALSFIILFNSFCENNRKNIKLFKSLWDEGKTTLE